MEFSDETLSLVKKTLQEYREIVYENEGQLTLEEHALEVQNDAGDRIWLHPREGGTSIDIHIMDASVKEEDVSSSDVETWSHERAKSKIKGHLGVLCCRDIHTAFAGPHRINYRIDFTEMHGEPTEELLV